MKVWAWLTPEIFSSAVSNSSTIPVLSSGNLACTRSALSPNATGSSPYPSMVESDGRMAWILDLRPSKFSTMSSGNTL